MRMKPGYWKTADLRSMVAFYHITEVSDGLRLDYYQFTKTDSKFGSFITSRNDSWTVPVESITEKEYFLAVLRGKVSR